MKMGAHPPSYPTIYVDGDHEWVGMSTMRTSEVRIVEGVQHYVVRCEISSFTHPFYTGQKKLVDTAGRVEKFMRRYGNQLEQRRSAGKK